MWDVGDTSSKECGPLELRYHPLRGYGSEEEDESRLAQVPCGTCAGTFAPNAAFAPPLRMALSHSQRRPQRQRRDRADERARERGSAAELHIPHSLPRATQPPGSIEQYWSFAQAFACAETQRWGTSGKVRRSVGPPPAIGYTVSTPAAEALQGGDW